MRFPRPTPDPSPLLTVACSTFETLALLYAEPADAGALGRDAVGARVAFEEVGGPGGGAADVAYRSDAVGELANVLCGNALPALVGTASVFHLAAPVASAGPSAGGESLGGESLGGESLGGDGNAGADAPGVAWLSVDCGRARVAFAWRGDA